jgi:hypothetical protein
MVATMISSQPFQYNVMKNHYILLPESTCTLSNNNNPNFIPTKLPHKEKIISIHSVLWADGKAATLFTYPFSLYLVP